MPEGDTIWRAARALQAALGGRTVTAFDSSLPSVAAAARRFGLVGRPVARVEAKGKHLLVRFGGGAVLHTHQGMTGSWHLYRRGSRWRQPAHLARVVLEAGEVVAVCFRAPRVELLPAAAAARHTALVRLGPDVMAEAFDAAEARARLRAAGDVEIAAALLDQSRLAGVGNIYKSEVLFLCGVSPFARAAGLADDSLDRVVAIARRQMRSVLHALSHSRERSGIHSREASGGSGGCAAAPPSLKTPARYWVYRRAGQPCLRCGTSIERRMQGDPPRSTYFCPRCQS
jgi:endonuclease VIII